MKKLSLLLVATLLGTTLTFGQKITDFVHDKNLTTSQKVDSLLSIMTLQEKIGQMNQYNGFWNVTGPVPKTGDAAKKYEQLKAGLVGSMLNVRGVKQVKSVQQMVVEKSRLGIPLIIGFDVIHGYKTIAPIPLAEAASWDLEAIKKSAQVAAGEAAASGINWTFAPMVDISRDARWGRVMEGAGEDPYLGSKIAAARVKGFQGDDLAAVNTIAACAKHFAAYGFAEAGKEYNTVSVGMPTLYNTILPPFHAASNAGVKTFMNSFNELNGIPATGNALLQRKILKGNWNFKGFVVSDWGSIGELRVHGVAKDNKEAAKLAVIAGSDMDMESYAYIDNLETLVKEKAIDKELINDAVRRILTVKFELGLFDNPYKYCDEAREKKVIGSKENSDAVLQMAKKSIVLLKNDIPKGKNNKLLPLPEKGIQIALIGALANDKNSPLGSWRLASTDNSAVSVLEGLSRYKGNQLTYKKGADVTVGKTSFIHEVTINTTDKSEFNEALSTAKNADVVIMVLGEHGFQTGEGRSRTNLQLPGVQQELLEEVYKVNPNIILVLNNGRPLAITWADEHIPAIIEAWQLGTQAGNAIAQVIYGDYNPSGKLPMTFPRNVGQVPIYYNHKNTGRSAPMANDMVFWSHYSDVDNSPLYPFGYGLSYTSFHYKNLLLDKNEISTDGKIKVSVDVSNTGNYDGDEVVQLYIRDLIGSLTRPVRELKGFKKIRLKAGETKTVTFMITAESLQFYTANHKWEVEPGDFELWVGGDSNAVLKGSFSVMN
ncbi:MAG TPA: beta-glucosidase BglX [Flavobacteriia bacterium]|nr:beta-glucosidase BglX [Flavobacteriia bacterium]